MARGFVVSRSMLHRPARPCAEPGCPVLITRGSRCPTHQRVLGYKAGSRSARGYTNAWLRRSRAAIAAHPWCTDCGTTRDLTTDHDAPLAAGGSVDQPAGDVVCRSCNAKRATSRRPASSSRTLEKTFGC
jgi:hypothetical protein